MPKFYPLHRTYDTGVTDFSAPPGPEHWTLVSISIGPAEEHRIRPHQYFDNQVQFVQTTDYLEECEFPSAIGTN